MEHYCILFLMVALMLLNEIVELLVEEVGKLLLRCDIMERIMKFKASSPKDAENKMEAIWEKFPHASVIEYPDERLDGIYMTVMLDEIELNKGGEDMDCDGKVINGVCDCHTHNCCPAVDGRSKLHPNCPHKEWVVGYRLFIARDVSKEVKAMYNKHGLKAFSVIKEDAETSLDNW